MPLDWTSAIDIRVDPCLDGNGNIRFDGSNISPMRYFPYGPRCEFRGKSIPTLTYMLESSSITPQILVKILSYLDEIQVFENEAGKPRPVLIVDGHES